MNDKRLQAITRRHFFERAGFGVGGAALASLLEGESRASGAQYLTRPAKAKNIIYLFMAGAPSHMDLFDDKPKLRELDGQICPPELLQGERFAFIEGAPTILGSPPIGSIDTVSPEPSCQSSCRTSLRSSTTSRW